MLMGFKIGIQQGTYQGKYLKHIAMGLEFLENMLKQSAFNLQMATRADKALQAKKNGTNSPSH